MITDWKFTGTLPPATGSAAAESLRKLVARHDAPGRSRFGLLAAPPEIASLRGEIPADPGQRAVDSLGRRLAGVLDRIAPQGGGAGDAPSSDLPRLDKGFPIPPKQSNQGKPFGTEGGEEAEGTAFSNESVAADKKRTAPMKPDPAQLQAIFQRHGIDTVDQHGRPNMEAQRLNPKKPAAHPSVPPHRAPSVAVHPKGPSPDPQTTEAQGPKNASILITTHGNEFLVERKSPLEIHAASLAEGRSASLGAAIPVEKTIGLRRNDLLRLAAPRQAPTENKHPGSQAKKPGQAKESVSPAPVISNSSGRPRSFREIGENSSPSSPSLEGRHDSSSLAKRPDSGRRWNSEWSPSRSDASDDFQANVTQSKAVDRPSASGQLGQLLARWEDQAPEAGETMPSHRPESMPSVASDSRLPPHFAPKSFAADPDEFARRVEDTLESVLIREIRRHGLDPEEP